MLVATVCVNRYVSLKVKVKTRKKSTLLQHLKKNEKPYIVITGHLYQILI